MADTRVVDPVCGMRIDPARAAAIVQHGGLAYHFCSEGCARRFQATPSRFVGAGAGAASSKGGLPMAMGDGPAHPPASSPGSSNLVRGSAGRAPKDDAGGAAAMDGMRGGGTGAEAGTDWKAYAPLATVFALLLAAVVALAWNDPSAGRFLLRDSIVRFMAGFFLVFAGFKLLDLRGFAEGYATYDLLAQKVPAYGYVYPFVELLFGLLMLAGYHGAPLLWAEILVMGFSGVGVAIKLAKKEPFTCACLGTFLKVPLTKVTLAEDFGMVLLAIVLLVL
jgi:YHS domain-containing protein